MTPEAAIYQFFSGFGIPAYASSSVPTEAEYPYLTYDLAVGSWLDGEVNITVNLWYYGGSEAAPNEKARQIGAAIGFGGKTLPCDGGFVWLKKGAPFCQSMTEDNDNVRRRYINISAEYNLL